MKKSYIKPQTVATVLENECAILAGSTFTVTVNPENTLSSDEAVGAKRHSRTDLWADDEE